MRIAPRFCAVATICFTVAVMSWVGTCSEYSVPGTGREVTYVVVEGLCSHNGTNCCLALFVQPRVIKRVVVISFRSFARFGSRGPVAKSRQEVLKISGSNCEDGDARVKSVWNAHVFYRMREPGYGEKGRVVEVLHENFVVDRGGHEDDFQRLMSLQ